MNLHILGVGIIRWQFAVSLRFLFKEETIMLNFLPCPCVHVSSLVNVFYV